MPDNDAYLHGEGIVSTDRTAAPIRIAGAARCEKRRLSALEGRRNYLRVKLQDMPPDSHHHARAELSALTWALEVLQKYFDHLNQGDCDLAAADLNDLPNREYGKKNT